MGTREFIIYLNLETRLDRYRHYHVWRENEIIEFSIQYEALIEGRWHAIIRYDTAHGQPHRDTLHADGSVTKDWFTLYRMAEVLTIGQRDIMENWPFYRERYENEMML
ncbi:MAG: hypothetical protein ISS57_17235 [Anaerolineales bacterium]|nr:hypothetical protein [Chloroflexota bacterium]MBL7164334.1 hypothetical protein [Anaerolineales bacterium]